MLWAIRWSIQAWDEVSLTTINRCWCKSTLLGPYFGPQSAPADWIPPSYPQVDQQYLEVREEVESLVDDLQQLKVVKQKMETSEFIDQPDEAVFDENTSDEAEAVIDRVMSVYTAEVEPESDDEEEPVAKITESAALEALVILSRYEEQQEHCNNALLRQLEHQEKLIKSRCAQNAKQSDLTRWFKPI